MIQSIFTGKRPIYLLSALFLGLSSTFIFPILSLFLVQEIKSEPFEVGFFLICLTVSGVVISQWWAAQSDKHWDRRVIVQVSVLASACGSFLFSMFDNYWLLLVIGVVLLSLSAAALPQIFALAKEDSSETDSTLFLSVLRAQISLAWIVGPPISFALVGLLGYQNLFIFAGVLLLLIFPLTFHFPKKLSDEPLQHSKIEWSTKIILLSIAFIFLFAPTNMYMMAMPLYLIEQLNQADYIPGLLIGIAALIEVPIMILAALASKKISLHRQIVFATFAGLLFYYGMFLATNIWQMILLQGLNAIFVGICAGIGISYFQSLMPNSLGTASTLYDNSIRIGTGLGSVVAGIIAQLTSYHNVLAWASVSIFIAIFVLFLLQYKSNKVLDSHVIIG